MNLLIDTHVLVWWLGDEPRLGPTAAAAIADPKNAVWVSAASAWEIGIKTALGRMDFGEPPEDCIPREIQRGGFKVLPVSLEHGLAVRTLPPHHGDPFDRLLIAQARSDGLRIVTADKAFEFYDVALLPAAT